MPRTHRGYRLEQNEAGFWEIRWAETIDGEPRSRRRSTRTRDRALAEKIYGSFLTLDEREKAVATRAERAMMVGDCLGDPEVPGEDYWTERIMSPAVADKATPGYARTKLLAHFGHLAVADIMPSDVADYVRRRRSGDLGRPSVNHTISRELSVLNAAIKHAVKNRRLPAGEAPFIEMPGTSDPRDRWLSEEEFDRLVAASRFPLDAKRLPRIYRFIMLAFHTASRKGAIQTLTWDQVDLDAGVISLNPAGRRQTKKRRPVVPISDELRPILEQASKERLKDARGKLEPWVMDHPGSIRTAFENAVERAGLGSDVTPHVLRHTWATWAALAGHDMFKIAMVLGDNLQTVVKTYAHMHPAYAKDAVNNVRPSGRAAPQMRVVG